MVRFSFKEASKTAIFFAMLIAALWPTGITIWNNLTIWKDDPASWGTIIQTNIVSVSAVLYMFWDNVKQRGLLPLWILHMNTDEVSAVVQLAKATGNHSEPVKQNTDQDGLTGGSIQGPTKQD